MGFNSSVCLLDAPVLSDVVLLASDIDGGPEPDDGDTAAVRMADSGSGFRVASTAGSGLPQSRHETSLPNGLLADWPGG